MNEIIPFGETWVPEAARRKISEWRGRPGLTVEEHRLIERLASHPDMQSRVWRELPATTRGAEGMIIEWAFVGARMAAAHRPLTTKTYEPREVMGSPAGEATAATAAGYAAMLLEAMRATNVEARLWWSSLWPGDPWVSFEKISALLEQVRLFYQALDQTGRQLTKALSLPAVRKRSEKAPERFFRRLLSNLFARQFGEPLPDIVAAITAVVFEKPQKARSPAVRRPQRTAVAPSTRKTAK